MNQYTRCDLCGGELSQGTTSLHLWHEKELVILADVPAGVCQQCGQSQIPHDVSEKIDQFLKQYQQYQPQRYIQVPEFSASQVLDNTSEATIS